MSQKNCNTQHKPWVHWPHPFDCAMLVDCSWHFQAPMPYWGRQTGHLLSVNGSVVTLHLAATMAATLYAVDYWPHASVTVQLTTAETCRVLTGLHRNNTENWHAYAHVSHMTTNIASTFSICLRSLLFPRHYRFPQWQTWESRLTFSKRDQYY